MTTAGSFTIAPRFCGPSGSGNGGYVCGRLAQYLEGPAAVRLHVPPPLGVPLRVESAPGEARLYHGATLVATARLAAVEVVPPPAPSFAEAEEASRAYAGFVHHAYPRCFVCGPQRSPGDGMRIFAGPVPARSILAAPWVPDASLGDGAGAVLPEFMWAALDCPGGFAVLPVPEGRAILLGEFRARIDHRLAVGANCVVAGWRIGIDGRKRHAGSAAYSATGVPVAVAQSTWIEVPAAS